jgi:hypothetical protein
MGLKTLGPNRPMIGQHIISGLLSRLDEARNSEMFSASTYRR